jgi:2-succinyl-5-enolpyruvyl-6-hydroxy-3-cyclohexene-1-carboxylate synthase
VSFRNRNELWGHVLVDELVRAGVRHVVVAPGSRSTPLVLAAAGHPKLELKVDIDERSAAFFALGVGKATGHPAVVVTTSGTAVANLMPAVVEACQAEVPLLLLTADRPGRLRGADANQAIDQERIFGRYTRFYHEMAPEPLTEARLRHLRSVTCRAVAKALGDPAGPVHLNLPFEKPLEPTPVPGDVPEEFLEEGTGSLAMEGRPGGAPFTRIHPRRGLADPAAAANLARRMQGARRPLLVAGPHPRPWTVGPLLRRFSARQGAPLLADPLSGARYPPPGGDGDDDAGRTVMGGYDVLLLEEKARRALEPDLIVRFGASPTSSRLVDWLETLAPMPQVVVDGGGRWKDHVSAASEMIPADPAVLLEDLPELASRVEDGWLESWARVDAAVRSLVERPEDDELFEGGIVAQLVRELAPEDLLFISSSMPVRELDAFAPQRADALSVLGNRGASGIDGILSTAAGASWGSGRRVVAVVGDLALLHDAAGLALLGLPGVRVVVVVLNNDGGGIFHHLPIREHEPAFTRYFATPHGRDLSRWAALYDLPFRRLDTRHSSERGSAGAPPDRADLAPFLRWALELDRSGVLELCTDREGNRRRRERALRRAGEAVRAALGGR